MGIQIKTTACCLLLMFVWLATPGETLKCYVCNSVYNSSCDHLNEDEYLVECENINQRADKNYTICRKESFSVESKHFEMETQRIIRSCGYEKHPKYDCYYSSNVDLKSATCECTEDKCNRGIGLSVMGLHISLGLVMSLLLIR